MGSGSGRQSKDRRIKSVVQGKMFFGNIKYFLGMGNIRRRLLWAVCFLLSFLTITHKLNGCVCEIYAL